jgi:hypothetical protein
MPFRNIDEYRSKKETKGNGSDHSVPHHRSIINGELVKRLEDGCRLRTTCNKCSIPMYKCHG